MRIFVTGGTGLVGNRLIPQLKQRQDTAVVLSRRPEVAKQLGCEVVAGDPTQSGDWQDAVAGCDAIINLAGEGVFNRRWNAEFKKTLYDSRIKSTENCAAAIALSPKRADGSPKVLVNASAIGYYGPRGGEDVDESTPPGDDFLAHLCVDWEKAAKAAEASGVRIVMGRIGVVLAKEGGALKQLLTPFKLFVGGPVGPGSQYMAWIHIDDVVGELLFALDNANAHGPMNVTAPEPVTNKEFGKALGRALGRPSFFWTPRFMLKMALGEVADVVVTGQRVLPRKAREWGYQFRFPHLDGALADILK